MSSFYGALIEKQLIFQRNIMSRFPPDNLLNKQFCFF